MSQYICGKLNWKRKVILFDISKSIFFLSSYRKNTEMIKKKLRIHGRVTHPFWQQTKNSFVLRIFLITLNNKYFHSGFPLHNEANILYKSETISFIIRLIKETSFTEEAISLSLTLLYNNNLIRIHCLFISFPFSNQLCFFSSLIVINVINIYFVRKSTLIYVKSSDKL